MSYMQELDGRLERLLSGIIPEKDIIIREVKAIALESYRSGQKAGAPMAKRFVHYVRHQFQGGILPKLGGTPAPGG